jgi:hypothetical protein
MTQLALAYTEKSVVLHPENGVTSNQGEGYNWKEGPVDAVALSFRFLQHYYLTEVRRGKAGLGNFTLESKYKHLHIPLKEYNVYTNAVRDYKTIIESINNSDFCFTEAFEKPTEFFNLTKIANSKELMSGDRISFVPQMGCFLVMQSTGQLYTYSAHFI